MLSNQWPRLAGRLKRLVLSQLHLMVASTTPQVGFVICERGLAGGAERAPGTRRRVVGDRTDEVAVTRVCVHELVQQEDGS